MPYDIPENYALAHVMKTGYPQGYEEAEPLAYCGECTCELYDESEVYEDEKYAYLCEDCLKMLHQKSM